MEQLNARLAAAKRAAARLNDELATNAAQLSAALSAPMPGEEAAIAQPPNIDNIKVGGRVTTPAGVGTIVEWNPVEGEGEVHIDGQSRVFLYPLDAADVRSGRMVLHNA